MKRSTKMTSWFLSIDRYSCITMKNCISIIMRLILRCRLYNLKLLQQQLLSSCASSSSSSCHFPLFYFRLEASYEKYRRKNTISLITFAKAFLLDTLPVPFILHIMLRWKYIVRSCRKKCDVIKEFISKICATV